MKFQHCCRYVQLCCRYSRLCRQCVRGQSNTLDFVHFQRSRPCWIQLCCQCVLGFRTQNTNKIQNKIQNKQTTIKTEHADISIKLSKLKENVLTYTNIIKLSNSLCKLSPNGRLNLTNWSRNCSDANLILVWLLTSLSLESAEEMIVLHRMIWSWYTGRWWVGCYIWYSEEGTGAGPQPIKLVCTNRERDSRKLLLFCKTVADI